MRMDGLTGNWRERMRDRARAVAFARFLWHRFVDDRLFQAAAALAYTTAFALVPLAVVVLGVLAAFPVFDQWSNALVDYVFSNFMPTAARAIESSLDRLAENSRQLTAAGVVADRKSTRLNSSHVKSSYAVFCLKKKN